MMNFQSTKLKYALTTSVLNSCLFLILILAITMPAHAGVAVIVAPGSSLNSVPRDMVRGIFLAKHRVLPNGETARPIDQNNDAPIYMNFVESVLGKSEEQMTSYWSRLVFSGRGSPLKTVNGDQAVIDYVRNTMGGIGYIDSSSVNNSVKVVYKTP